MPDPPTPTAALDQVPRRVLEAFGLEPTAASQTVRAVPIVEGAVIRPVDDAAEATWCADLFETLDLAGVRLPRPLRSPAGAAVVAGWCGWERLAGQPDPGRWRDVLAVADRLHRGLADTPRPRWMDAKDDLWRRADRHAWDEVALATTGGVHPLQALLTRLDGLRVPTPQRSQPQLVHIDLLGNVLFAEGAAPAVIDPTFYWRPTGYAAAVVAVDAATWTSAGPAPLEQLAARGELDLLVRAARFRVARDVLDPDAGQPALAAHTRVVDWLTAGVVR